MTEAYPLQWPAGRPRTANRRRAKFSKREHNGRYDEAKRLTISDALGRLSDEIDRIGARQYVLSSNLERRLDGLPRSGQAEPQDPGVCLYFHLGDKPHCLPCDTFDRAADNIAAIAAHLEATRAIERYGVATLTEMFAGFAALPAPGAKRPWREVLGVDPTWIGGETDIDVRFRSAAKNVHPDRPGGSHDAMSELNRARDEAMKELTS